MTICLAFLAFLSHFSRIWRSLLRLNSKLGFYSVTHARFTLLLHHPHHHRLGSRRLIPDPDTTPSCGLCISLAHTHHRRNSFFACCTVHKNQKAHFGILYTVVASWQTQCLCVCVILGLWFLILDCIETICRGKSDRLESLLLHTYCTLPYCTVQGYS